MNIQLKKIHFSETLSDDSNAFTADLWCDGKKVGTCRDDGNGGCVEIHSVEPYKENRQKIDEMIVYCKSLPSIKTEFGELPMDLELYIGIQFEEWLKKKEKDKLEKRMKKDMDKGIVIEVPNGYQLLSWKGHTTLSLLSTVRGTEHLKTQVDKLLNEGKKVLNTNLPFLNNPHVR